MSEVMGMDLAAEAYTRTLRHERSIKSTKYSNRGDGRLDAIQERMKKMERFSKTMTGTVLALGLVLGAATSASAFNPQPDPPAQNQGAHKDQNSYTNPSTAPGYLRLVKPAEFNRARKVPQVLARINKPQAKK